jgi:methyl-accepting chemotaxis protein
MAKANLTSIEELDAFRSASVLYQERSLQALDAVTDHVARARSWLTSTQLPHWKSEVKRRARLLDQAEQELLQARLSEFKRDLAPQQINVRRARAALESAEEKLRTTARWIQDFDAEISTPARRIAKLREDIHRTLERSRSTLESMRDALVAYAEDHPSPPIPPPPPDAPDQTA